MMLTLQLLILAGGVSVELPSEAEATGTMITLGEIAEVTSADPAALAAVNGVELGYMPAPGYSRTLQRWKIERAVTLAVRLAGCQKQAGSRENNQLFHFTGLQIPSMSTKMNTSYCIGNNEICHFGPYFSLKDAQG